jgi:site-specific recombinase XerD
VTRIETDVADHLSWLAAHGYATTTLAGRARHLSCLVSYLAGRGVSNTGTVCFSDLEGYQLHLHLHRKANGEPLSFRTQSQRLIPVKVFFAWAARSGRIALDPAAGMVLPRVEHRLPEATLTAAEVAEVLRVPDVTVPLGVRDRAIMEVLYSSAIRRAELIALRVHDIDRGRKTLFVRQGKGRRDRHVPIGPRALSWVERYEATVRPHLACSPDPGLLFLSASSGPLCADWFARRRRLHHRRGAAKARELSPVPPHLRHLAFGGRRGHPLRGGDARAPEARDHQGLHAGLDRQAAPGARRLPSGRVVRVELNAAAAHGRRHRTGHDDQPCGSHSWKTARRGNRSRPQPALCGPPSGVPKRLPLGLRGWGLGSSPARSTSPGVDGAYSNGPSTRRR